MEAELHLYILYIKYINNARLGVGSIGKNVVWNIRSICSDSNCRGIGDLILRRDQFLTQRVLGFEGHRDVVLRKNVSQLF